MQEFTSISVSSYEAESLTALLNEKSGDGWNVVSIVPTGSTITAYLSKESTDEAAAPKTDRASVPGTVATAAAVGSLTKDEPKDEPKGDDAEGDDDAGDATDDTDETEGGDDAEPAESKDDASPVDEPAGWAAGATAAAAATSPSADAAATPAAAATTPATTTPVATTPAAVTTAAATPAAASTPAASTPAASAAAATTAAAASAAPAGWYADPSSRYELRYWDGSQWTEHVSRAGQQFTDPPVA